MSTFAIVILSVIGLLFKFGHHSMMGSTDDPQDGAAVAATVFGAVIIYAVCFSLPFLPPQRSFSLIPPYCHLNQAKSKMERTVG